MRNAYGTDVHTIEIRNAWKAYWAAVAIGDEVGASRARSRVERFERMAMSRRSTLRMLAVVASVLPGER